MIRHSKKTFQILRQRVLEFVASGGSKIEAARRFSLARCTVYEWLGQPADHVPGKPGPKGARQLNRDELLRLLHEQPDLLLRELATRLGVAKALSARRCESWAITVKKRFVTRKV